MTDNEGKCIQLQVEHHITHFLLYNNQKYPINFDLLKSSSKYFYERRYEIPEDGEIILANYDPDDNMKYFPSDEVIEFIKYIQFEPIQLTNDNIFTLHHLGQKYEINQLIASTEEYINQHEDEVLLKFLKRKEILRSADLSFYEDKIASNFSVYVNKDDIISLDICTLYRILEKVSKNGANELKSSSTKDFLMKVLDERGRPASILFKYADISAFDDEALTHLLTKYSQRFEFEFIAPAVLNAYLSNKEEHKKYEEESAKKYEAIAKELQEQKNINKEMSATLENERQTHKKYEEESVKKYLHVDCELQEQKNINKEMRATLENERQTHKKHEEKSAKKYEAITKELQEQKNINKEMSFTLENERQTHKKYEEESAKKYAHVDYELQEQKNINKEMRAILENERQTHKKHEEESAKKYEAIAKELQEQKNINDGVNKQLLKSQSENEQLRTQQQSEKREHEELCRELDHLKMQVMSTRDGKKDQVNSLVKYLIKENDKQQEGTKSVENVQEIFFYEEETSNGEG